MRAAGSGVPQPRLLDHASAPVQQLDLPVDFVLDRFFEMTERVDVLHLRLGAERLLPTRAHRDVGVAAQAPLFHVAVVDAEPHQDVAQAREELGRLGGGAHVRLRHDLDERHAAPVVVDVGAPIGIEEALMQRLARVFLHVDAGQSNPRDRSTDGDVEASAERQRPLVLRDLVALGQVRVEVVLPREDRFALHGAAKRQGGLDGEVDGLTVEHRKRARKAEADRADLRIRQRAEGGAAAAEDLGAGPELGVYFEPDDGLVPGVHTDYALGPASLTEGATSFSNVLKFSTNIPASLRACSS